MPSVAALSNGGFVVAWTSYGQDRNLYGRYGQRYSAAGAPIRGEFRIDTTPPDDTSAQHREPGPKFRVNTTEVGQQRAPSIAALANGGFVVVW